MIKELHQPSNAQPHQKSIVETIKATAPIWPRLLSRVFVRVYITHHTSIFDKTVLPG